MPTWLPDHVAALRDVRTRFSEAEVVLVGAAALNHHLAMDWRKTNDLDLTLACSVADAETAFRSTLKWERHPNREHEWYSPRGVKVDVLPAGPDVLEAGVLVWPESGNEMNMAGFHLAFEHARTVDVAADLVCRVATLPVIIILKMVSFLDRPNERERDLGDIGHVMENYATAEDWPDEAFDLGFDMDNVHAALLGLRVGGLVSQTEAPFVEQFTERIRGAVDATQANFTRLGPGSWHGDPKIAVERVDAFMAGFAARRA